MDPDVVDTSFLRISLYMRYYYASIHFLCNTFLVHAFAPSDGRIHLDGDEVWVDGVVPGKFDLQTIGLHELSHVLGLGHTNDGGAIMYPTTGSGFRKGLGQDDIDGIKAPYHL
ncbi:hypothetical protein MIMGU_mgv11b019219mg [Erythranthe guttata]|uniref:Peptidase M10 metallopeptidase domain-containing protein n=1 Tax=Erythranthe guttata TaxID=4155 RepID=A0A022QRN4_ERYGU|nr:hypothetical protein MIMGU_mgv11b019219mg [Erythranthe guttata]